MLPERQSPAFGTHPTPPGRPRPAPVARPDARFDALLDGVQSGEPSAWDDCYRWLAPAVAGYLRLQGARDVDDLTSEVFLSVFRNVGTFAGTEAQFRSWVFVIAHRRLQDERRRRFRRPPPAPLDDAGPEPGPHGAGADDDALRAMGEERVVRLCGLLGPDQRAVVLLRVLGDLSIEHVAEVLGKSPGAVKQLQHRAFGALRRILEHEGVSR